MTYKVEISRYREPDEKGYMSKDSIYEQDVENLDIRAVIAVVNGLQLRNPLLSEDAV